MLSADFYGFASINKENIAIEPLSIVQHEGKTYKLYSTKDGVKKTDMVKDENDKILATSCMDLFTEELIITDYENKRIIKTYSDKVPVEFLYNTNFSTNVELMAEPVYHKQSTISGNFAIAELSVAAVALLITNVMPGAGWAIAIDIASQAINNGLDQLNYKIRIYTAQDKNYYYVKSVFQAYTIGGTKIGPSITTKTKKHMK